MSDDLGDRMKLYESLHTSDRLLPNVPMIARIDGRAFHSFTKGLERPYDVGLSTLMLDTTKFLVEETNAILGYTQSDEISLLWYSEKPETQSIFGGKVFKIVSGLASLATYFFNSNKSALLAGHTKDMALFDCRVFNTPNLMEAHNYFLWRELDCTKNAISMTASSYYSHNELLGKNGSQKQEMLFKKGINFNNYPEFFKAGTYVRKKKVLERMSEEQISRLPTNSGLHTTNYMVERSKVYSFNTRIAKITNKEEFLLGEEPKIL
jgi:tRNA(His) guanylyltransferase